MLVVLLVLIAGGTFYQVVTTSSDFYRYLKYVSGVVPHATAK